MDHITNARLFFLVLPSNSLHSCINSISNPVSFHFPPYASIHYRLVVLLRGGGFGSPFFFNQTVWYILFCLLMFLLRRASWTSTQVSWHSCKPVISDYVTPCVSYPSLLNHCPIDGPNFLSSFAAVIHHKMSIWCVYLHVLIFMRQCPGAGVARFKGKPIFNWVDVARWIFRGAARFPFPQGRRASRAASLSPGLAALLPWQAGREGGSRPVPLNAFSRLPSLWVSHPVFSPTGISFYFNCASMLCAHFHLSILLFSKEFCKT